MITYRDSKSRHCGYGFEPDKLATCEYLNKNSFFNCRKIYQGKWYQRRTSMEPFFEEKKCLTERT
jgi:hypothetical protein